MNKTPSISAITAVLPAMSKPRMNVCFHSIELVPNNSSSTLMGIFVFVKRWKPVAAQVEMLARTNPAVT